MKKAVLLSTLMVAAGATTSVAQGFTGAELGLEFQYFDDFNENTTSYYGGAEFMIVPQFAVAADLSRYSNSAGDDSANSFTLHGIYKLGAPRTGVGLFVGQDSVEGVDVDIFGAEGALNFGQGRAEGFIGSADAENDNGDITFIGAEFEYDLGRGIGVIGSFDYLEFGFGSDDFSISTLEIGGSYLVADMVTVFAKIGTIELDGDDFGSVDDNFISIGAEIGFGPDQGLTFSPRSLFSSAPLAF